MPQTPMQRSRTLLTLMLPMLMQRLHMLLTLMLPMLTQRLPMRPMLMPQTPTQRLHMLLTLMLPMLTQRLPMRPMLMPQTPTQRLHMLLMRMLQMLTQRLPMRPMLMPQTPTQRLHMLLMRMQPMRTQPLPMRLMLMPQTPTQRLHMLLMRMLLMLMQPLPMRLMLMPQTPTQRLHMLLMRMLLMLMQPLPMRLMPMPQTPTQRLHMLLMRMQPMRTPQTPSPTKALKCLENSHCFPVAVFFLSSYKLAPGFAGRGTLGAIRVNGAATCLVAMLLVVGGVAKADSTGLSSLETDDLRLLYYDPLQTYLTPYIAQAFENSMAYQRKKFGFAPWDKVTVQLEDFQDAGNASVRGTPNNGLTVNIAPDDTVFETFSPGERFFTLMNHELVHVATLDAWNEQDAWWRNIFHGKPLPATDHPESILYAYLAAPRTDVPRWFLEGTAVFMETWMGGGLGRAQGGYDEMVFRAMVRDDAHFYSPLGLASEGNAVDFQVGANDYLYGTRFISYLAFKYGPQKVVDWVKRGPESKAYYANQFEAVFGKPLPDVWNDWIAFEHAYQKINLASVQKYPVTPVTRFMNHALGSASRAYYDPKTNSLIAGIRDVGQLGTIAQISLTDGSVRKITPIKGASLYRVTSLVYDPDSGKAYYTTDNYAWRDLMELDVATGERKMLLEDDRIGALALNRADKSIWGIRHLNGLDTLVRIRAAHDAWNQVLTFDYGTQLSDLDISPDGTLLCATISEIDGSSRLDVFRLDDLLAGKFKSIASLHLGTSIPEGGAFSPDGKYVYATSYYTGVSNVYRLNVDQNAYEAVSNAVTGFFTPLPMADGSLIVYEYTGHGFEPVKIDPKPLTDLGSVKFLGTSVIETHPELADWAVGSPSKVDIDPMIKSRGTDYDPDDEMTLDSTYPVVAGYKGHVAVGWYAQFEDPLMYDKLSANISYSPASDLPNGQQLHADINYSNLFWHFTYWHNKADFYDLFGPTERARKGDALLAGYNGILIYDPPRQLEWTADVNLYSGLDVLPGAQNIESHDPNIATAKLGIVYTDITKSLGAVDSEDGWLIGAHAEESIAHGESFPSIHADFNIGTGLPWNHASVWTYNSAGVTGGTPHNALDYFFFGAFGNNYVDDREIKRYRDFDSFPGFGIDQLDGRSYLKSTEEFNLPPIRLEDVGAPAFYLSSIRSAVFAGVLNTDPGTTESRTVEDVGFQTDWNFTVAVHLPMTLSIGDAIGVENGRVRRNEIMVSLKIL